MKILSQNVNYFLGFNGKISNYILNSRRGLVADPETEFSNIHDFADIVVREQPDVVFLAEVDSGSIRTATDSHIDRLNMELEKRGPNYNSDIENKYGEEKIYSELPLIQNMSNAVLYRDDFELNRHYLSPGSKQLVYELRTGDISIFGVHLPLVKYFRRRQLDNLAELVETRDKAVVTGDFNNYYGRRELQNFADKAGLEISSPGEALHNSFLPYREIDLFLHSGVDVEKCTALDLQISDHLPVLLETRS